jgi:hypothetical protein
MNNITFLFASVLVGALGFGALHPSTQQARVRAAVIAGDWVTSSNRLFEMEEAAAQLRQQVATKKGELRETAQFPKLAPEVLALLESDHYEGSAAAWVELRQQLNLGWDASPDYVLVNKSILNQLDYKRLQLTDGARDLTDNARELLAISPNENLAVQSLCKRIREQWAPLTVERTEPAGNLVAQYSVRPPGPEFERGLSNAFRAELTGDLGGERARFLLPDIWREYRSELGPGQLETLTVRRVERDGQPDLVYEMKQGSQTWGDPVRYAHYPSSWFLTLFSGGWKTLAEKEGFELPATFKP